MSDFSTDTTNIVTQQTGGAATTDLNGELKKILDGILNSEDLMSEIQDGGASLDSVLSSDSALSLTDSVATPLGENSFSALSEGSATPVSEIPITSAVSETESASFPNTPVASDRPTPSVSSRPSSSQVSLTSQRSVISLPLDFSVSASVESEQLETRRTKDSSLTSISLETTPVRSNAEKSVRSSSRTKRVYSFSTPSSCEQGASSKSESSRKSTPLASSLPSPLTPDLEKENSDEIATFHSY